MLQTIYSSQSATVVVGSESRVFPLGRGVKQSDPISPILFLAVMEVIFRRLKTRWNKLNSKRTGRYYGIVIDSEGDPLTNLRVSEDFVFSQAAQRTSVRRSKISARRQAS